MEFRFRYRFEAAHRFIGSQEKCATPHGHTWHGTLVLSSKAPALSKSSMICDFEILKKQWRQFVMTVLDHSYLHNVSDPIVKTLKEHTPNARLLPFPGDPTTEMIGLFCFHKMQTVITKSEFANLVEVKSVVIEETITNVVEVDAESKKRYFEPFLTKKGWWTEEDILDRSYVFE